MSSKPLPKITPDGEGMRTFATLLKEMLPVNFGFALLVFELEKVGLANYISSCDRNDMIKALRETADRIEKNKIIDTPNQN